MQDITRIYNRGPIKEGGLSRFESFFLDGENAKFLGFNGGGNLGSFRSPEGGGQPFQYAMKPSEIRNPKNPGILKLPGKNSLSRLLKSIVKH